MKRILQPILVVLTGLLQAFLATIFFLCWNALTFLWDGSTKPLRWFSFSSHSVVPPTSWGMVLGYLDGTLGLWSWIIPYGYAKATETRVRLMVVHFSETTLSGREEVTNGFC